MTNYAKARGYQVEQQALRALKHIFPNLKRTGSMAYKKDAADLIQEGHGATVPLVVTRDKNGPLLVTLSTDDFFLLVRGSYGVTWDDVNVVVQVKARQTTWVGGLYQKLRRG